MKSYDFDAVVIDGTILCVSCLPKGVSVNSEFIDPIFADSEWEYAPICDECGAEHDYVTILERESTASIEVD